MELWSDRLSLRRLTPTERRTVLAGGRPPGQAWAAGYPLEGTLVALAMQTRHEDDLGTRFGHFQVVLSDGDLVIGDVGFHSPPDDLGETTIGYGIVPAHRGHGYASEAVRTLITWALEQPEVRSVRADTDPVNLASQYVLLSAGLQPTSDDGDSRTFEIQA